MNRLLRFLVLVILAVTNTATAADRPNVVFIFADDLGYGDVGCYGATKVKTPSIDRLATEGRMFTDAHSASAVCTPSRYGLLTGDYPFRQGKSGVWGPLSHQSGLIINTKKLTLGKLFKDAGYATACVGKWHLGFGKTPCDWNKPLRPGPMELGFDYYFGVPKVNSGFPYVYVENDRIVGWDPKDPLRFKGKPISPTPIFPASAGRKSPNAFAGARKAHAIYDDERTATLLTEKATAWIKQEKDKPFFLYLAPTNIHHPFTPHPRFKGTSECGLYGDFIHELDWMVGEVLRTLDDEGLAKNTLVIFTSDNGGMYNVGGKAAWKAGHRLNGDLLGFKFGAWEGGHRIPLVVRWPGHVEPGSKSNQLLSNVDMMATMAALVDRKLKDTDAVDSFNMLEAIVGEPKEPIRDHLIASPREKANLALRKGKWLYIGAQGDGGFATNRGGLSAVANTGQKNSDVTPNGKIKKGAPKQQLYDLEADPSQTTNIVQRHPGVASELRAQLQKLRGTSRTRD